MTAHAHHDMHAVHKPKRVLTRHGFAHTRTYQIWRGMRRRCCPSRNFRWMNNYYLKGIRVALRWESFINFLADMGIAPDDKELDRIDNAKGYGPGNCRWATKIENSNNKSTNRVVVAFGETKTVSQWFRDPRCAMKTKEGITHRLNDGWTPEDAIAMMPSFTARKYQPRSSMITSEGRVALERVASAARSAP